MKAALVLLSPLILSASPPEAAMPPCYFGLIVQPEQVNPNEQPQHRIRRMTRRIA